MNGDLSALIVMRDVESGIDALGTVVNGLQTYASTWCMSVEGRSVLPIVADDEVHFL